MTELVKEPKKFRLPKKFAKKFLSVLRSGKYKQTTDYLVRVKDGVCSYCVLGVAGRLQGCIMRPEEDTSLVEVEKTENLPKELISDSSQSLSGKLMGLNDGGKTFPQIADWIDENVELYDQPEQLKLYEQSN